MSNVEDFKEDKKCHKVTMDLDKELSDLSVDLVCLCQELFNAKLRMETTTKCGWLHMAKARYIMGPNSVGRLQLPESGGEKDVLAEKRVHKEESKTGENKVQYYHHTLVSACETLEETNTNKSTLKQRRRAKDDKEKKLEDKDKKSNDPIKWFGFLSPSSLRLSQDNFKIATVLAVECANIQSELLGVESRIKYIQRLKVKAVKKRTDMQQNESEESLACISLSC